MAELPEALITLTQALEEDAALRGWFRALEQRPASARAAQLLTMAAEMAQAGEAREWVEAIGLLVDEECFRAVARVVRP